MTKSVGMNTMSSRVLLVAAVAIWCAAGLARVSAAEAVSPRQAIERAAASRLGSGVVQIDVESLTTTVQDVPGLVAMPDPAGVVGRAARFQLTVGGKRRGVAVASVRVRARVAKLVKPVERDGVIEADAVTVAEEVLEGVRFGRLPQVADVIGARARRDLAEGAILTGSVIATPQAVVNGDRVTVGVTIGRVHVTGEGVASGSGEIGDVIHVMQAGRRPLLKARVVERGVVEVMP